MLKLNIKRIPFTLLAMLICLPSVVWAQSGEDKLSAQLKSRLFTTQSDETVTLFIYFKDKGDKIEEKLQKARANLSPQALERRIINRGAADAVNFKDVPVNPEYVELIRPQVTKLRHQLKAINAVSVEASPSAIATIEKYDFVQRIELVNKLKRKPDPEVQLSVLKPSLDTTMKQNANLALDYGESFQQVNQIRVPEAHDLGYSGSGIVIAIFDGGFNRLSHESFNQMNIGGTWDFVNNDSDVGDGADMGAGDHGTNTLSTIGGYSPGTLIGPAYGATYFLAKTENTESELHVEEDNWCAAAEWADTNGAHIITSSLGYSEFDSGTNYAPGDMDGDTTVVTVCADLAAQNGIVVVNSAGNSGAGNGENTIGAPSDGHFVLAVGSVTSAGLRSSFSSVGPTADGRIKPDVMAMGSMVLVASSLSDVGYIAVNGTSFACPLTAGVAALVLQANPGLTATQVRDILRDSGNNAAMPDNQLGYGIIDAVAAVYAANGQFVPRALFNATTNLTTVSFTNNSTDSDGTIVSHSWNFGDGSISAEENPSHTYAADGTYTVTLTVTDSDGLTGVANQTITVSSPNEEPPSSSSGGGGSIFYVFLGCLLLWMVRIGSASFQAVIDQKT